MFGFVKVTLNKNYVTGKYLSFILNFKQYGNTNDANFVYFDKYKTKNFTWFTCCAWESYMAGTLKIPSTWCTGSIILTGVNITRSYL